MAKANEIIQTKNVKTIKAKGWIHGNTPKFYEIAKDTLLCLWNLIAIILYTDYSAHCSEFSASFRRLSPFEPLEITKKRNAMFWWMAKTLRETVELFGQGRDGHIDKEIRKRINKQFGPFYCGVNKAMIIPSFNIRLNAPTSTTMQIEVALKFGGMSGTIIQLNNDSDGNVDLLRSFNVSFISRYPSEDERLFIGGYQRIRVQSIKLLDTKQNFAQFIAPLYYLDAMLTAKLFMSSLNPGKNAKGIIEHLFKYKLGQNPEPKMDSYLYETFDGYTRNKEHIMINFYNLRNAKESMS